MAVRWRQIKYCRKAAQRMKEADLPVGDKSPVIEDKKNREQKLWISSTSLQNTVHTCSAKESYD